MTKCDCVCISREEYNRLKECNGNKKPRKPKKKTTPKKLPVEIVDEEIQVQITKPRQSAPRKATVPRIAAPKVKQIEAPRTVKKTSKKTTKSKTVRKNPIEVVDYVETPKVRKTATKKKTPAKKKTAPKQKAKKVQKTKADMPTKWAIPQIEAPGDIPYRGEVLERRQRLPSPRTPALPMPDLVENWRSQAAKKNENKLIRQERRAERKARREERSERRAERKKLKEARTQALIRSAESAKAEKPVQYLERRKKPELRTIYETGYDQKALPEPKLQRRNAQLESPKVPQLPAPREPKTIQMENCDKVDGFLAKKACQIRNRRRVG